MFYKITFIHSSLQPFMHNIFIIIYILFSLANFIKIISLAMSQDHLFQCVCVFVCLFVDFVWGVQCTVAFVLFVQFVVLFVCSAQLYFKENLWAWWLKINKESQNVVIRIFFLNTTEQCERKKNIGKLCLYTVWNAKCCHISFWHKNTKQQQE